MGIWHAFGTEFLSHIWDFFNHIHIKAPEGYFPRRGIVAICIFLVEACLFTFLYSLILKATSILYMQRVALSIAIIPIAAEIGLSATDQGMLHFYTSVRY
jgi:hypothetical protein